MTYNVFSGMLNLNELQLPFHNSYILTVNHIVVICTLKYETSLQSVHDVGHTVVNRLYTRALASSNLLWPVLSRISGIHVFCVVFDR